MVYDRKIKYFDYLEQGERLCGAGYIKMQRKDNNCVLEIMLNGLHKTDTLKALVYIEGFNQSEVITSIEIQSGCGKLMLPDLHADDLGETGIAYDELSMIRIPISKDRELLCKIRDRLSDEMVTKATKAREEPEVREQMEEPGEEEMPEAGNLSGQGSINDLHSAEKKQNLKMADDKWQYLQMVYEHIKPFRDEREYLSIGLSDFLILSQQSYQLVHNSFLVHGYLNYHHLILHRCVQGGQVRFYVGVPGVLYEKEKQVAGMYGFESFEGSGRYLSQGDFGYYMIPVTL